MQYAKHLRNIVYLLLDKNIQCFSGAFHIALVVIGLLLFIIYLFICLRLATVEGELDRVAIYNWFTWKHDKPDTKKINSLSRKSVRFQRPTLIIKLITVMCTVYLVDRGLQETYITIAIVNLSSLVILLAFFIRPPFHYKWMNAFQCGLLFLVQWTNLVAIYVQVINNPANLFTVGLHIFGIAVAFVIGFILMLVRIRFLKKSVIFDDDEEAGKTDTVQLNTAEVVELEMLSMSNLSDRFQYFSSSLMTGDVVWAVVNIRVGRPYLSFQKGSKIVVESQVDIGTYMGVCNGQHGMFEAKYVSKDIQYANEAASTPKNEIPMPPESIVSQTTISDSELNLAV